jgi:allophanate hydrolase subunit 2
VSGIGGLEGRRLHAGDRLPLGVPTIAKLSRGGSDHVAVLSGRWRANAARLRVMAGPQVSAFDEGALDDLQRGLYTVTSRSDRMGYRLTGGLPIRARSREEMISDAVFLGAVQIPPSGHPILLMADRQTTGGYPQIAIVITADLPIAAQLAPGDAVRFELCRRSDAMAALVADERAFLAIE